MRTKIFALACLLVFLTAGCSPAATPALAGSSQGSSKPGQKTGLTELNRDRLENYTAAFQIQFNGASSWKYQLTTRKAGALREDTLSIEGIEKAKNPGDVRIVTDGTTTWMIGEGTDQECVRFPNNQGMDTTLFYPESLISQDDLSSLMRFVGEGTTVGRQSLHYSGSANALGTWQNLQMDVYQEKSSGALLQFAMLGSGEDPVFGTGAGSLMAQYAVSGFDAPAIEPVAGCDISVPLPESAKNFVRLPGMSSFDSPDGIDQVAQFYQGQLPGANWAEIEPPAQSEGSIVLSYRRDAEEVEIHIEGAASGGSKVKLLFLPVQ